MEGQRRAVTGFLEACVYKYPKQEKQLNETTGSLVAVEMNGYSEHPTDATQHFI